MRRLRPSWLLLLALPAVALLGTPEGAGPATYRNPILSGFHPDPSICRVGDTYYLVNSSFEWFPGVPIFRSHDLINWEQIGHVLDRPSQLAMRPGLKASRGIWAPTIRYHDGLFYMVTTAQDCGGNFFVTAQNPSGPWSDPVWIKEAPGIDPTIFWDDDGSSWYLGSGWIEGGKRWPDENRIFLQRLDLKTGTLLGERYSLTSGHAANARWAEGPHLYKRAGKYVLMIAEGGTGFHHAVTVFESERLTGPYVPDHANPVLTHRNLGWDAPIQNTGHADLVETPAGETWAVLLGVRPRQHVNRLGRETFLAPVSWQGTTPVFNPNVGRVLAEDHRPPLPWTPVPAMPVRDNFDAIRLAAVWNFLRTPRETWWNLARRPGWLELRVRPESVTQRVNPSLVARRIEHFDFRAATRLAFTPLGDTENAGLVVMQNDGYQYRLVLANAGNQRSVRLSKREAGRDQEVACRPLPSDTVVLAVTGHGPAYTFLVGADEATLAPLGPPQDASVCSTTKAGGFTGPFVGMYASSEGQPSDNTATFDWFDYQPLP